MSRIEEETPHSRLHWSGQTCALGPACHPLKEPGRASGLGLVLSMSCLLEHGRQLRGSKGNVRTRTPVVQLCNVCC